MNPLGAMYRRFTRFPRFIQRSLVVLGIIACLIVVGLWRRAAQEAQFWIVADEIRRLGGQIYVHHDRAEWSSALPARWTDERSELLWVRKVNVTLHSDVTREQFQSIIG